MDIKDTLKEFAKEFNEPEFKLAYLLAESIVFINNGWWNKQWPEGYITIHVNCNDIFAWGCADSEDLKHDDIDEVFEMYEKDPVWGIAIWCIKRRKQKPQEPVEDSIRKQGIWNLDEIYLGFKKSIT